MKLAQLGIITGVTAIVGAALSACGKSGEKGELEPQEPIMGTVPLKLSSLEDKELVCYLRALEGREYVACGAYDKAGICEDSGKIALKWIYDFPPKKKEWGRLIAEKGCVQGSQLLKFDSNKISFNWRRRSKGDDPDFRGNVSMEDIIMTIKGAPNDSEAGKKHTIRRLQEQEARLVGLGVKITKFESYRLEINPQETSVHHVLYIYDTRGGFGYCCEVGFDPSQGLKEFLDTIEKMRARG